MSDIFEIVKKSGAAQVGAVPYGKCTVINPNLEKRLQFTPRTVIIGIVPYYTRFCDQARSVSAYALAHDYHKLLTAVCSNAISKLTDIYPDNSFKGFVDHSPINEKLAAAQAGLGIIGDNSLLITERFSSFVFLFEIITDLEIDIPVYEIKHCEHCGACKRACPADINDKKTCLSAITQKKGDLNPSEIELIRNNGFVWGCDLCQLACPHTKKAMAEKTIYTNSDWFNSNVISDPCEASVNNDEDFSLRAYSWRGKQTILRNIKIVEERSREVLK